MNIQQVAESRLEVRNHRPEGEACRDPPFQRIVTEVNEIKQSVKMLDTKVIFVTVSTPNDCIVLDHFTKRIPN